MNLKKYLLGKLAEELSESIQIVMKAQLFGHLGVNPETGEVNIDVIVKELNDVLGVIEMLRKQGIEFNGLGDPASLIRKEQKIVHYASLAIDAKELILTDEEKIYFKIIRNTHL